MVVVAAIAAGSIASPASPRAAHTSLERGEVVEAFDHLVGPARSAVALRPYVQGVDTAMAAALAKGAANQGGAEIEWLLPKGTLHISAVHKLSASVASVAFRIADSN